MALSAVNIIGDVTQLLEDLLAGLSPSISPLFCLTLGTNEKGKINIYLYQVLESPHGKNSTWRVGPGGEREYPPLALKLYYLLTPYGADLLTEHHILGDAMRVLYDHGMVRDADLPESLRLVTDQVAIILMPLQLEELTRIWSALQSAYRLSVAYEVRVVPIRSTIVEPMPRRVETKIDRYALR